MKYKFLITGILIGSILTFSFSVQGGYELWKYAGSLLQPGISSWNVSIPATLDVTGHSAFGANGTVETGKVVNVVETISSDIDFNGLRVDVEATVPQTHPNWLYALRFNATYSGVGESEKAVGVYGVTRMESPSQLNKAVGMEGAVRHDSTGLIVAAMGNQSSIVIANEGNATDIYGYRTYFNLQATGTVETAYSYFSGPPDITGAGGITDFYSFYAKNTNKATNNYGFYQQGANLVNIFENGLKLNTSLSLLESGATPTYYTILQSGDLTGADSTYILPTGYPAVSGYVLSSTTGGIMSWVAAGGAESDPIFIAWLAGPPDLSEFNNDVGYLTAESDTLDSVYTRGRTIVMDLDEIIFDVNDMTNSILGFDIDIPGGSGTATMDDNFKWDEDIVITPSDIYTSNGLDIKWNIDFSAIDGMFETGRVTKFLIDMDVTEVASTPPGTAQFIFGGIDIDLIIPGIGSVTQLSGNFINFKSGGNPIFTVDVTGNTYVKGTFEVDGTAQFDGAATFNSTLLSTSSIKSNSATLGIGYGTGAGGTVTQATSKSTGVTINKVCGTITMHNAALAAGTIVTFTVTNSAVAATDNIYTQHNSGGTIGAYTITANTPNAGSFKITVRNNTAGSLSDAIVIRFAVIKSVIN